jgi:hypothetical protein
VVLRINRRIAASALGLVLAATSCQKHNDMPANTPTGPGIAAAVPRIALGPGFAPAAFAPGRYATAIQRTLQGTHALQVMNEDSTSAFSLELTADGAATACRGWRYVFRNDGPTVHTEDNYREQQGYRGRYKVVDGVAEVELVRDDAVCAHVFQGALALARAPSVRLRCVLATPSGGSPLTAPVLMCRAVDTPSPDELAPQVVESLAPAGWFVLGSGHGLRVWMTGRPPGAQAGDDVNVVAKVADAPLGANAWERAF